MNAVTEHGPSPVEREQDAMTRILMHGMHEETMFYNRINFFMLIEALLFTSLMQAEGLKPGNSASAAICAGVGILVTIIWFIVQFDKFRMFRAVSERLENDVPDFARTLLVLRRMYPQEVQATKMLTWFPATVCGSAWLVLLIWKLLQLWRH